MYQPQLKPLATTRATVDVFRGYNHNLRIGEGEFFEMENMSSDGYPVLTPRMGRSVYADVASPQGLVSKDKLCYVDGADFVIGDSRISMGLSVKAEDNPKQLVSMGAFVIILPDKKYVNTASPEDFGNIEAETVTQGNVEFTLCASDGTAIAPTVSPAAPENPENLDYWIDTSGTAPVLKQYAGATEQWVSIAASCIEIRSQGIGRGLRDNDGVELSGITVESAKALNGSHVLLEAEDDRIVIPGLLEQVVTQTVDLGAVTVKRTMPVMDFVTESGNRLWGCRYGLSEDGQFVNEIYASALGDFRNWKRYQGLSTDSYAASCGTDGPFTGAITHLGYPLFFKENCLHKVYGSYPAVFQIQTISCRGVEPGSHRSLAIVNERLYYKARGAVCVYDGSLPEECSYALGAEVYHNAVGGSFQNKYYISMEDGAGRSHLMVFDTAKGLWHREDNLRVRAFCAHRGAFYAINAKENRILNLTAGEEPVSWFVETGELGMDSPDRKYITRITFRLSAQPGTVMALYAQYDRSGQWELLCNIRSTRLKSFSLPVRARRCDTLRLRLEGRGFASIYSYTKTMTQGSEGA